MLNEDQALGLATKKSAELIGNNIRPNVQYVNRFVVYDGQKEQLPDEIIRSGLEEQIDKCLPQSFSVNDISEILKFETPDNFRLRFVISDQVNKNLQEPIFFQLSDTSHWVTITVLPNPVNKNEVAVIYMNSMPKQGLVESEAAMITNHLKERGLKVIGDKYIDCSKNQQCQNNCGYAVAMNIADLTKLYSDLTFNNQPLTESIIKNFKHESLLEKDKIVDGFQKVNETLAKGLFDRMNIDLQRIRSQKNEIKSKEEIETKHPNSIINNNDLNENSLAIILNYIKYPAQFDSYKTLL